jgi:hypothetical protein
MLTERGGYEPQLTHLDLSSRNTVHAKIQLSAGWVLGGTVFGPDGQPVVGALVTVAPSRRNSHVDKDPAARSDLSTWSSRRKRYIPIPISRATAAAETDLAGLFQLNSLAATYYDLSIVADDLLPTRLEMLNPEFEMEPLAILLETGSSLEGRVLSSTTGKGVDGAVVIAGRLGYRRMTRTDPKGTYHIGGLPEGEVDEVRVQAEHYGLLTLNDVSVAAGVNLLELQLVPAVRVSGVVSDASGLPVSGAWVHIAPALEAPELDIAEDERMRAHLQHNLSVRGQTDATGHFEIENVNPVSYLQICVRHPAYGVLYGESFRASWGEEISGLQFSFPNSRRN